MSCFRVGTILSLLLASFAASAAADEHCATPASGYAITVFDEGFPTAIDGDVYATCHYRALQVGQDGGVGLTLTCPKDFDLVAPGYEFLYGGVFGAPILAMVAVAATDERDRFDLQLKVQELQRLEVKVRAICREK